MCYCGCPYERKTWDGDCRCEKPRGAECWLNSEFEDPDEYVSEVEDREAEERHFWRTGEYL